ncbi:MAG: hypothetical protein ACI36X_08635 [Bacteroidaceae bacterium]
MKNKKTWVIAAITILILAIAAVTTLLVRERKEKNDMAQLFSLEKEEMENEYTRFASQYDELQYQLSNDSLIDVLEKEKVKTQRLLEELRSVKTTNAREIMRLKKELATVRAVLRTYVVQIDSLNRLNQELSQENKEVKKKYNEATRQISNLAQEKKELNEKVELASQLDATAFWVKPQNKRGRETQKVKDVTKLAIGFTITKNISARTGERILYVRITKPDNDVLTKKASDTFPYENRTLNYSIKKYIEYNGEEQDVTVYWNVEEFLYAGTYRIDLFADGVLIGSSSFSLK